MKLPELRKPEKYAGLYIFDFGDHVGVGFTAEEVAELLESEKYKDGKVYKIHRAYPDGKLELKGVTAATFALEAGMFFYSTDLDAGRRTDGLTSDEREELGRLRRANKVLTEEREILVKAAAFFVGETGRTR